VTEPLFDRLPEVAREIGRTSHFLLCLDFDGTLAPIVPFPADSRMPGATRAALERLVSKAGTTVAIVSGRACENLRSCVGMDVILAGNHGLEIMSGNTHWRHPTAVKWQPALHEMCAELRALAAEIPGAFVEDKGLTASVHYRNVASAGVSRLSEIVNAAMAPREDRILLRHGKKVFEILPRVAWDKGSAVLRILEQLRAARGPDISVCYIGDDATDECAFRKLTQAESTQAGSTGAITVRVGESGQSAARFGVADATEVGEFLHWLIADAASVLSR
jgi:trehalose 6-phosphate phosphatase